ncbi:DUF664 domain-containing protein [Kitasatospora sp. NPDC008115]|uniref:mycothiol transferase n=1 Tax=Kitasatospora sp. NPDC008115 TaxID=3364022 RepID=UPI0036DFEEAA
MGILDGLDDATLRRPVLPSGRHCLGPVQHLALDVERFWFRAVAAGDEAVIRHLAEEDDAWRVSADVPAAEVLARYRREAGRADAVIAAGPADRALARRPHDLFGEPHPHDLFGEPHPHDLFGEPHPHALGDVLLHVITDTACHAGHLDAARELLGGRRRPVLP